MKTLSVSNGEPVILNIDNITKEAIHIVEVLHNSVNGKDVPTELEIHHISTLDSVAEAVAVALADLDFLPNAKHTITLILP